MAIISNISRSTLRHINNKIRYQFFCRNISSEKLSKKEPNNRRIILKDGPGLEYFIANSNNKNRLEKIIPTREQSDSYLLSEDYYGHARKVYFIIYGCQMNFNDTEIVRSILFSNGYTETNDRREADVILLMTCSIREGAEDKVRRELRSLKKMVNSRSQTVAILGCMAERVRHQLLSEIQYVDIVAGPDSYRDLPRLLAVTQYGSQAINVQLSLEETYADIAPVRADISTKSAYVSIMRGCDNMCTFCIVPFTRGRERSRPIKSIIDEVKQLSNEGIKQVVLLGQNVNSYRDTSEISFPSTSMTETKIVPGFKTIYKPKKGGRTFVTLLDEISKIDPEIRIRFTSPHPKDFPHQVIELIKERKNICRQIHLPAQSGSNEVLNRMGRGYTRESYIELVNTIRNIIPDVSLTSDFIAGFCGETEFDHQKTIDLIRQIKYSFCFVFPYSMREKTRANYRLVDDIPMEIKQRRHQELATAFREEAAIRNQKLVGTIQLVLIESKSKRSASAVVGRIDGGTKTIIENGIFHVNNEEERELRAGDYVMVKIESSTSQTLVGRPIRITKLQDFEELKKSDNIEKINRIRL